MQYCYPISLERAREIAAWVRKRGAQDIEPDDVLQQAALAALEAQACAKTFDPEAFARVFCCTAVKKRVRVAPGVDAWTAAERSPDLGDPLGIIEAEEAAAGLDPALVAQADRAAQLEAAPLTQLAQAWKVTPRQARNRRRAALARLAENRQGELFA